MALKKFWGVAIAFSILVGVATAIFAFKEPLQSRHVFINETEDHRFDESIKVSILAAFKRTGVQNAVIISDKVNEDDFEKKATETFQQLSLGRANQGRAILYYFSPKSRSLKIEIGYALEMVLPDATVKGLEMAAKSFIYVDRYQDFWAELINTLNIEVQKKEAKGAQAGIDYDFAKFTFLSGGGGISSSLYLDSWQQLLQESRRALGPGRDQFRAQSDLHSSIALYLESLAQGFGDIELDLLTKESQFFRKITPQSSYQMFRNARMSAEAGIDQVFVEKNLAFVFFKPGHPVLPLILKQTDGKWRLHEPLSWSLFQRYEDSNQVFLKFPLQGLSKELRQYIESRMGRPVFNLQAPLTLAYLAQTAASDWKSSQIHLYWLDKAEVEIEKTGLSSLSNDELMMAADVHMNLGHISKFLAAYKELAQRYPEDGVIQKNWEFYQQALTFKDADWVLSRP